MAMTIGAAWVLLMSTTAVADGPAALQPRDVVGEATRVVVELKGEGLFKPAADASGKPDAKGLALKVESRVELVEKVVSVGKDRAAIRTVRRVEKAGAAINGEVRATSATLRPEVATLIAERIAGQVVVVSPGGPLTRQELELVQGPGDPLALNALLPAASVAKGDAWTVGSDAARMLSGYDALDDNALKATLESIDEARAVVRLKGEVRGSALGGPGTIGFEGTFGFDRKLGRVDALEVDRVEVRKPGPVEAGLDVKSTLKVTRRDADVPAELSDGALAGLALDVTPERELLVFKSPGGVFSIVHDRDWHIEWDGAKRTLLKRLSGGRIVANCLLAAGPSAGKGRHQDPAQLRDDVKRAIGPKFVAILGEGVVDAPGEAGYRYKIAVQGREGEVGVVWYYYLLASPGGEQVLAVFTLAASELERFAGQDLKLVGALEWTDAAGKP